MPSRATAAASVSFIVRRNAVFRAFMFVVTSCYLAACAPNPAEPRAGVDLSAVPSPDGKFVAKVREVNIDGSVMVSQPFQVIVNRGSSDQGRPSVVLIADRTEPLRVAWSREHQLLVCYADAQIFNFHNRVVFSSQEPNSLEEVEVLLVKRSSDSPCADGEESSNKGLDRTREG